MKIIFLTLFTCSLFAQNIDEILDTLLNFQQENKPLHVNYNPFKNSQSEVSQESTYVQNGKKVQSYLLKAILNKKAFINTSWYEKGDKIDNAIIKQITEDTVSIEEGSKVTILKLDEFKKYMTVKE